MVIERGNGMGVTGKYSAAVCAILVAGAFAVSGCLACSAGSTGASSSDASAASRVSASASSSSTGGYESSGEAESSDSSESSPTGEAGSQEQGSPAGRTIVTPYYTVEIPAGWPDGAGGEVTYEVNEDLQHVQGAPDLGMGCMTSIRVGSGRLEVACFTDNWGVQGDYKSVVIGTPPNLAGWRVMAFTPSDHAAETAGITPFASRIQEFASFVKLGGEGGPVPAADPSSAPEASPVGEPPSRTTEPTQADSASPKGGESESAPVKNAADSEKAAPESSATVSDDVENGAPESEASGASVSNGGQDATVSDEARAGFESRLSSINSAKSSDARMGGTTADMIQAGNDYYAQYDALMDDVLAYLGSQPGVDRSQLAASQEAWRAELTTREQEAKAANGGGSLMGIDVLGVDMEMQEQRIRELINMIP